MLAPIMKKAAFTCRSFKMSRIWGVQVASGPSSKVIATRSSVPPPSWVTVR